MGLEDFLEGELIQSQLDDRVYKRIVLDNGMKVLLISDAAADKASAALSVNVGFNADPKDLPGLAHFLEHMLFLGTEKYPEENNYSSFLSMHSGSSNAFTSHEETNYFFEVSHEFLEGALDRFAQFFIAPLFTPSCTERELNAVDSENRKNLQSDLWRLFQLVRHLSVDGNSFNRFGTGNIDTLKNIPETLGIDVRASLLEFHEKYYSANIMSLCILGRDSLDQLEAWAKEKFSKVPNKNAKVPVDLSPPLDSRFLSKKVYVVPVKDTKQLDIAFQFPGLDQHFLKKPERYLAHLLGHEGPGSVLSLLKSLGYASSLSAGCLFNASSFSFFNVSIELTQPGLEKIDEIISIVFQYIAMLKKTGVKEWIFSECKKLAEIDFRFKEKKRSALYTSGLVGMMPTFPGKYLLSAGSLYFEYDMKLIEGITELLNPRNARVFVISKELAQKDGLEMQKEPWYGTQFWVEDFSEDLTKILENPAENDQLFLHPVNEFVAEKLDILPTEPEDKGEYPVLIKDGEISRVWFKKDSIFLVPKANIEVIIRSPMAYSSPLNAVSCYLLCELLIDELGEYTYSAELAGLRYSLGSNSDGISLSLSGYNDKQEVLLEKIVGKMANFRADLNTFARIKEHLILDFENWNYEPPREHASFFVTRVIQEVVWSNSEKLECLRGIQPQDIEAFAQKLFKRCSMESLFHGNMTRETALALASLLESRFAPERLFDFEKRGYRSVRLSPGLSCYWEEAVFDPNNKNSAVEIFFQTCHYEEQEGRSLTHLVAQCISDRFFAQIRTKEQLGYSIASGVRLTKGSFGIRFVLQSLYSPRYLELCVERYLLNEVKYFETMEDEEFAKHVNALILRKLEKSKNLRQETNRLWENILRGRYDFDQVSNEVAFLRTVSKKQLASFYETHLVREDQRAKVFSARISKLEPSTKPDDHPEEVAQLKPAIPLGNVTRFKSSLPLFPLFSPVSKFLTPPASPKL